MSHGSCLPISEKSGCSRRAACVSMRVLVRRFEYAWLALADFGEIGVLSASRMREHAGSRFDVLSTHGSCLPISEKSAYSRRAACVSMRVLDWTFRIRMARACRFRRNRPTLGEPHEYAWLALADFGEIGLLSASRTNMHGSLGGSEKSAYLPMHTSSSWRMVPSSLAMRTKMWS